MIAKVKPAAAADEAQRILKEFRSLHYLRHNQRRQEHLAGLGLPLHDLEVLEVGAGIGDHTTFFLDRGCAVTSVEGREQNCAQLRANLAAGGYGARVKHELVQANVSDLKRVLGSRTFDIVYCYGLLYHVSDPLTLLADLAAHCRGMLLLETCVSFGNEEAVNPIGEPVESPTQSVEGTGCRPTRPWLMARLRELFAQVYVPITQPDHEEFPLDWDAAPPARTLSRAVFIASRSPIRNALLVDRLPQRQRRS